jgi:DNA polymerase kappa
MPGYIALKLCPELKIVPLNFSKYREASAKVRSVFEQYDPHYCPMSLDEVIYRSLPPQLVMDID